MNKGPSVLIVDDQVGDIGWLIDLIQSRGYMVVLATNEEAAMKQLDSVKQGKVSYALAIVDVMVAIMDLMDLIALEDKFLADSLKKSEDTGIRLCEYARETLGLSEKELPIICITIREDPDVREAMKRLGIRLFNRASYGKDSIRQFIEDLPSVAA
jgi:CheY-like chemotaxis protein